MCKVWQFWPHSEDTGGNLISIQCNHSRRSSLKSYLIDCDDDDEQLTFSSEVTLSYFSFLYTEIHHKDRRRLLSSTTRPLAVKGNRVDPLNHLRHYRNGYDVTNKHYWAVCHSSTSFIYWACKQKHAIEAHHQWPVSRKWVDQTTIHFLEVALLLLS
jgi:hypothetical protein